jgi:Caudovirus prohead serine protease
VLTVEGFAMPYGVWCRHQDYDGYSSFAPGSFTALIAARGIRLNLHHQQSFTLASQDTDTLDVVERDDGVYFTARIADARLGRFLAEAIALGLATNICANVYAAGTYLQTAPDAPKRIVQTQVGGADFAILIAGKGHYPQTWIKVR